METSIKFYSLSFSEMRTYLMAALFVVCNIVLPQLHLQLIVAQGDASLHRHIHIAADRGQHAIDGVQRVQLLVERH